MKQSAKRKMKVPQQRSARDKSVPGVLVIPAKYSISGSGPTLVLPRLLLSPLESHDA